MRQVIANLIKRGFIAQHLKDRTDVIPYIAKNIPAGAAIGFGGSVTVDSLGIPQALSDMGYKCGHTAVSELSWQQLCIENRSAEYYISGTNAISRDGILVNIDGRSNRVSAMCYGPRQLFIIAGKNKIADTLADAMNRAQNIAAPLNAQRLHRRTPCAVTGKCENCLSPDTICRSMLILYHPTTTVKTHVLILNEELGY